MSEEESRLLSALSIAQSRLYKAEKQNAKLIEALDSWQKRFENVVKGKHQKWENIVFDSLNKAYCKGKKLLEDMR